MKKYKILCGLLVLVSLCLTACSTSLGARPFGSTSSNDSSRSVWHGDVATAFAGGSGSAEDPYRIETAAQLAYLAQIANQGQTYASRYYKLCRDIVLSEDSGANFQRNWTPIGTRQQPFQGHFDGDDHKIFGLYINTFHEGFQAGISNTAWQNYSETENAGLFGAARNATIANTHIVNAHVEGGDNVGGIIGYASIKSGQYLNIENCSASGTIGSLGYGYVYTDWFYGKDPEFFFHGGTVGGIAGTITVEDGGTVTIADCCNTATVTVYRSSDKLSALQRLLNVDFEADSFCYIGGRELAGGIIGELDREDQGGAATIYRCGNTGAICGADYTYGRPNSFGGIAGCVDLVVIDQCFTTGTVTPVVKEVSGALVGTAWESTIIGYVSAELALPEIGYNSDSQISVQAVSKSDLLDEAWLSRNLQSSP